MIRHLRPTDTAALLPFRRAAGTAQAFTVAGALHSTFHGFPVTRYVALALSPRAWRQCWVDADEDGMKALARVGARTSPTTWETRDLFTVDRDEDRCAELLHEVGVAAAARKVMRVFLRAEQDSWLTYPARRAGYEPAGAETLYVLIQSSRHSPGPRATAGAGIRAREATDDPSLFRLYCAAAPVQLRVESGMTATEWWSALEKPWRKPDEVVLERNGEIVGWLRHGGVQGWWFFTILARPNAVDRLPELVHTALAASSGRPVATLVPAFDTAQAAVLERLGFVPERRFQVMAQTLVARVREPKGVVVAAS